MAELIKLPNNHCDLKFHAPVKKFKGVRKFSYKKHFFKIYVNKNDSVYDIKRCVVLTWKTINKNGSEINIPDQIEETRDAELLNKIRGNQYKTATYKVESHIDWMPSIVQLL